jgi:hypothetical protein
MLRLNLWIIPNIGQVLEPVEKFSGLMDLSRPLADHVKII